MSYADDRVVVIIAWGGLPTRLVLGENKGLSYFRIFMH